MKTTRFERVCTVLLFSVICLGAVIFFGVPFLNMFGVIAYDPVMSQPADQIVCVELLEKVEEQYSLYAIISDEKIPCFVEDFMDTDFRRYVNDPPTTHGERIIKICYADGGYDLIGVIVDLFDPKGNKIPVRGWYYMPYEDIKYIFEEFGSGVVKHAE